MVPVHQTEERIERVGPLRPRLVPPSLKLIGPAVLREEVTEERETKEAQEEDEGEDSSDEPLSRLSALISRRTRS